MNILSDEGAKTDLLSDAVIVSDVSTLPKNNAAAAAACRVEMKQEDGGESLPSLTSWLRRDMNLAY